MTVKTHEALTLGLDIGIASVGWAVLSPKRIVALGVRAFDAAEEPKTGASLNEHRRTVKTQRNRLKRRVQRLKKLRRLLRDAGAVPNADASNFQTTPDKRGQPAKADPWQLRAKALEHSLEPGDWARVLYHIVKHRGFFAARKSETVDETREGGKLSKGVKRTAELLQQHGWRTIGEMAAKDQAFAQAKRNKAGNYINSFSRKLLGEELRLIFEKQRSLGNAAASPDIEAEVWNLFSFQKPAITGAAMLAMIGHCTFEPDEYRAPKRSFSAERFIWLSKLNNIKVIEAGSRRALTEGERQAAVDLPYKLSKVTWKQLRKAIKIADSPQAGFAGLSYGSKRNKKGDLVDPEDATLVELKGWHALKKELDTDTTRAAWERLSGAALSGAPSQMDAIALALSIYKTDDELRPELAKLGLVEAEIESILKVEYTDFLQLSTKAIGKLLPHLASGLRYDEACTAAGYNHAKPNQAGEQHHYLPGFSKQEVRNPVVFRALNQARKVINAIIRAYGSPSAVHVELARDLSRSFDDRMDIKRGQEEFQAEKKASVDYFIEQIGRTPRGDELLKMRLYREQDGQCAYSLKPLAPDGDIGRIFETGQTQIDHVLPYSRSFDDSQNNKVLVLTSENQNKGNRTPFEYLDGANAGQRWREFDAWVRGHKSFRKAKRDRLLRVNFGDEEAEGFRARNLNDTRYITRFIADYIRQHLAFAPDESGAVKAPENRVLCPAGGYTGFLRARWGLIKDRAQSDLHHALDACVIAAASRTLQKRVSDFSRRNELVQLADGTFADKETGEILHPEAAAALGERFPLPWVGFRNEVEARLSVDGKTFLEKEGTRREYHFANYTEEERASVRPVLVSRAVKRRAKGAVHQDTVRSIKSHLGANTSSKRVPLTGLKMSDLENIVGVEDARNAGLISALRIRLEMHKGDGKKAFGPNTEPVCKPRRDGTPGPIIRAVKIKDTQKGGVPVRGGVADQASIWRVDVFCRGKKYYLVPIYQSDRKCGAALPNKACVAHKPRDEWDEIDETYDFRFSLHPNDLIRLNQRGRVFLGYFAGTDIGSANISINTHDRNISITRDGQWRGLGVKIGVDSFDKFHVDVLGNAFPVKQERRRGLA